MLRLVRGNSGCDHARNLMASLRQAHAHTHLRHVSSSSSPSTKTMDSENVMLFTRLASQWWDPQGEFALLHAMNPVRLQFMREKLREVRDWDASRLALQQGDEAYVDDRTPEQNAGAWLQGQRVLDVGCGGGLLSESLARLGADVLGVDASPANVKMAEIHAQQDDGLTNSRLQYKAVPAEDILAERGPEQFDIVCAMEVVEHVKERALFLNTLRDLCKPGGHIFMSTIARTPLSYFLTIFMAEDVLRLVTRGTHKHDQYVNPDELVRHFVSSDINDTPQWPRRMQYETRGTFYIPGLNRWSLAPPREASETLTQSANYFFWFRKPL